MDQKDAVTMDMEMMIASAQEIMKTVTDKTGNRREIEANISNMMERVAKYCNRSLSNENLRRLIQIDAILQNALRSLRR